MCHTIAGKKAANQPHLFKDNQCHPIQTSNFVKTGKPDVTLIVNDIRLLERSEYRTVAELAQRQYNLSDAQMMSIYEDYKEDYDA